MEIVRQCLDRHSSTDHDDYDKEFLLWEGNYWDEPVHDCSVLSLTTCKVLVNKIAVVLDKYCKQNESVLLLLPQVIQLPLSILAGFKTGVAVIPLDPGNCDAKRLENVLREGKPSLIITVDAFWLGQQLQKSYESLSGVLEQLGEASPCRHVLVIRHTSPNPGVPPPEEMIPARRPYYGIEWSIEEGRDVEWSEEIRMVDGDVQGPEGRGGNTRKSIVLFPNSEGTQLRPWSLEDLRDRLDWGREAADGSFPSLTHGAVLCLIHPEHPLGLLALLSVWANGQPVVQYEGQWDYPDAARIAHIVRKYQAKTLVLPETELDTEYLKLVDTGCVEVVAAPRKLMSSVKDLFPQAKNIEIGDI